MRSRVLTYSNVMSSLAVFMVLGGGAYAAATLPKNSVGTQQIKKGGVRSADIAKGSVGSSAVKDGSLTRGDFKRGELTGGGAGGSGQDATTGPIGPQGPPGTPGTPGTPGASAAAGRDGAALITTYRNTQPVTPNSGADDLSLGNLNPFTGASWTQPAGALDWFFARMRVSFGADCRGASEELRLSLRINNVTVNQPTAPRPSSTSFPYPGQGGSHWYTIPFRIEHSWLAPPATDTPRQFLALGYSTCGQQSITPIRIEEFRIDVVRAVG